MFASISSTVLAATAILGAATLASTASAAPIEARSVAVDHRDLDLASAEGAATFNIRLRRAVSQVCGTADSRDLVMLRERNACRTLAMQAAQPKMELAIANARGDTQLATAGAPIHVAAR